MRKLPYYPLHDFSAVIQAALSKRQASGWSESQRRRALNPLASVFLLSATLRLPKHRRIGLPAHPQSFHFDCNRNLPQTFGTHLFEKISSSLHKQEARGMDLFRGWRTRAWNLPGQAITRRHAGGKT